jgi:hypothetical protein
MKKKSVSIHAPAWGATKTDVRKGGYDEPINR